MDAAIKAYCNFVLRIDGYELQDSPADYHDANWLVGRVDLEAGSSGQFTGRLRATPFAPELQAFRDQLVQLDRDLSGTATLAHLEDQFGIENLGGRSTSRSRAGGRGSAQPQLFSPVSQSGQPT